MASITRFDPYSTVRATGVVVTSLTFMVLATFAFGLRLYCKRIRRSHLALDDYILMLGVVFFYISSILLILRKSFMPPASITITIPELKVGGEIEVEIGGLGHQMSEVEHYPTRLLKMGKLGLFGQYPYALTMTMIRWSICILFLRIFVYKLTRRLLWGCIVANGLWLIFNILAVSLRCSPFSKNWNVKEPGYCAPQVPIVSVVAGTGVAIEFIMWIIPVPAVWSLNMPRRKRIAITCILGLGMIDIAVGIVRLVTVLMVNESNLPWSEVPALNVLAVEPAVAIVVASLCVCHPLLDRVVNSHCVSYLRSLTSRLLRTNSSITKNEESVLDDNSERKSTSSTELPRVLGLVGHKDRPSYGGGHFATAVADTSDLNSGNFQASSVSDGRHNDDRVVVQHDVRVSSESR